METELKASHKENKKFPFNSSVSGWLGEFFCILNIHYFTKEPYGWFGFCVRCNKTTVYR
jgi:hypothetical protein